MMYFLSQGGDVIAVRTGGDPAAVMPTVRASIQADDQSLRISAIETIPCLREQALTQEKLIAKLASFFGVLALLLAGIGVYGVMSYGVLCRRHEVGIRMALGAQQSNVVWMVLSEALWLGVIGSTIGISGALAIGRLVSSQLFGVQVADPLSIAAVSTVLIAVAGVAGYVPARRASHVDPMAALRHG